MNKPDWNNNAVFETWSSKDQSAFDSLVRSLHFAAGSWGGYVIYLSPQFSSVAFMEKLLAATNASLATHRVPLLVQTHYRPKALDSVCGDEEVERQNIRTWMDTYLGRKDDKGKQLIFLDLTDCSLEQVNVHLAVANGLRRLIHQCVNGPVVLLIPLEYRPRLLVAGDLMFHARKISFGQE